MLGVYLVLVLALLAGVRAVAAVEGCRRVTVRRSGSRDPRDRISRKNRHRVRYMSGTCACARATHPTASTDRQLETGSVSRRVATTGLKRA